MRKAGRFGRVSSLTDMPMSRKHIKGSSLSRACGRIVPHQIQMPVLHVRDIEGTVLAPIQAAPEDLPVPNKFADAFSCSHKCHEEVCCSRCSSKVALQGRSTNGYEDFPVESDTDERETHLDEFVGPQLEPQLSTLTRASS